MNDLLVVGLDRTTGREVHIDDAPVVDWYAKGHSGDQSLICRHCYAGVDAPAGTVVPLVVKGKLHGKRRPHFSHPPGRSPAGGHNPESVWHTHAKQLLASWARVQPGVACVNVEHQTPDGRRRSDVGVRFTSGARVALEAQYSPLPDAVWLRRHHDYRRAGITDVWFWHERLGPERIMLEHGSCPWALSLENSTVGIPIGRDHERQEGWWDQPHLYADHHLPCPADDIVIRHRELADFALTPDGLTLPAAVRSDLLAASIAVTRKAREVRETLEQITELQDQISKLESSLRALDAA